MSVTVPPFLSTEGLNLDNTDRALLEGLQMPYGMVVQAHKVLSAEAEAKKGAVKWAEESDDDEAVEYREWVAEQDAAIQSVQDEIDEATAALKAKIVAIKEAKADAEKQLISTRGAATGLSEEELTTAAATYASGKQMLGIGIKMIADRHSDDAKIQESIKSFLSGFGSVRQARSGKTDGAKSESTGWRPRFTKAVINGTALDEKATSANIAAKLGVPLDNFKEMLSEQAFAGGRPRTADLTEGTTYSVKVTVNGVDNHVEVTV